MELEKDFYEKISTAAERVINSLESGITKLPNREAEKEHEEAYNEWLMLNVKTKSPLMSGCVARGKI